MKWIEYMRMGILLFEVSRRPWFNLVSPPIYIITSVVDMQSHIYLNSWKNRSCTHTHTHWQHRKNNFHCIFSHQDTFISCQKVERDCFQITKWYSHLKENISLSRAVFSAPSYRHDSHVREIVDSWTDAVTASCACSSSSWLFVHSHAGLPCYQW